MKRRNKTVSLVLGSGGARGLAHIGVIGWLNENEFDIQSISGSSIGALIGGIYATGKLEAYAHWVTALEQKDVFRLLDFSFGRNALFKGERIISVLKDLIGDCNIEELPISFTAVATDVDSEKEIWLNRGSLFDAIRASIAIPTIFTPHRYKGMQLLDGALVNPIPIAPVLNDRTDVIIAVNLGAKPEAVFDNATKNFEPQDAGGFHRKHIRKFIEALQNKRGQEPEDMGLFDVVGRSYDTMQNAIMRLKLAAYSPDIIIDVPRNVCAFYEFHRARELIEIGRERAESALFT